MSLRQRGYLNEARSIVWQNKTGKDVAGARKIANAIVNDLNRDGLSLKMTGRRSGDVLYLKGTNANVKLVVSSAGRGRYKATWSGPLGGDYEATGPVDHVVGQVVASAGSRLRRSGVEKEAPEKVIEPEQKKKPALRYVSSGYAGEDTKAIKWKKKPGREHKDAKYVVEKMVNFLNGTGNHNLVFRGQLLPRGGLKLIGKNGKIQIEKKGSNFIANVEVGGKKQTEKESKEGMVAALAIAVNEMGMK